MADRFVEAGQLFGRRQRSQRLMDFAERAFDAAQCRIVAAAVAAGVDAFRELADLAFDRFNGMARHRLGDGLADVREFAAESRNRLFDALGLQRLDLAGDLRELLFEAGDIRRGSGRARGRCATPLVAFEFALSRKDFSDREIERGCVVVMRRGGGGREAVRHRRPGRWRRRDPRQPFVEARDGVVELVGRRPVVFGRLRDLIDLPRNGIQPLMNFRDVLGVLRGGAAWRSARCRIVADGGIQPFLERHACASRGSFGPFADGWLDAVNAP